MKNLTLSFGKSCTNLVWPVVHVPLYVLPASAMTSRITTQDMESRDTAAGIPACTLISP